MGYKIYGEDNRKGSRLGEFAENFFAGFMTFSYCIGSWLVHFGLSAGRMFVLAIIITMIFVWKLSSPEK